MQNMSQNMCVICIFVIVISENKLKKKTRMAKYGTKSGLSNAAEAKKEIQEDSRQSTENNNAFAAYFMTYYAAFHNISCKNIC